MMKAVIETATGRVAFLRPADCRLNVTERGLTGALRALDIMPDTHHVEIVPDNPDFVGGAWGWIGGEWVVIDQEKYQSWQTDQQIRLGIQRQEECGVAIQTMLNEEAKKYRYDSIYNLGIYEGRLPEATPLADWAAACWKKSFEIEQEVLAGSRPLPTVEEVMAEMPTFQLPPP